MALLHYRVDYSNLSDDEFSSMDELISRISYDGFHINPMQQVGDFYIDDKISLQDYPMPDCPIHLM